MNKIPTGKLFFAQNRDRNVGENDKNRTIFIEDDHSIIPLQFTQTSYEEARRKAERNKEDFCEYHPYDPELNIIIQLAVTAVVCAVLGAATTLALIFLF